MAKKVREYKPGDFVFAKVKGYPAWPARVRAVKGKKYMVLFYGTSEIANLPGNVIFDYVQNKDKFLSKSIKRREFIEGVEQIEKDIAEGVELPPADESLQEVNNSNDAAADTTGADGDTFENKDEDTTVAEMSANVSEDALETTDVSQQDDVPDSEDGALVIDETKKKGLKRGSLNSGDGATKAKQSSKQDKTEANSQPAAEESQEQNSEEPETTFDKAKKISKSVQKSNRRTARNEPTTPQFDDADLSLSEVTSRSGRKIKPKRFLDEDAEESAVPALKRARSTDSNNKVTSASEDAEEPAPTRVITEESINVSSSTTDMVPEPQPAQDEPAPAVTASSEADEPESTLTKPTAKPAKDNANKKRIPMIITSTRCYNIIREKDITNLKEPFGKSQDSNDARKKNILVTKLNTGKLIGIKLFHDKPPSFKSELARLQWENVAAMNAVKLKHLIENRSVVPNSIENHLELNLDLTPDEVFNIDAELENDMQRQRINFLKTENKLMEVDIKIRACLGVQRADVDQCIKHIDEMADLDIAPVMLLKHAPILETVKRMRRYVGNPKDWNMNDEQMIEFKKKAHIIRKKAEHVYSIIKSSFAVPEGANFYDYFGEKLLSFQKHSEKLTEDQLMGLIAEPPDMLLEESQFANLTAVTAANEPISAGKPLKKSSPKGQSTPKAKNGVSGGKDNETEDRRPSDSSAISDSDSVVSRSTDTLASNSTPAEIMAK